MNLNTLRKDYWNTESFRMILREAVESRPEMLPYLPNDGSREKEQQIDEWLSQSAEQAGFDKCFKLITGHYPGEMK